MRGPDVTSKCVVVESRKRGKKSLDRVCKPTCVGLHWRPMRRELKRLAERTLVRSGAERFARRNRRDRTLILAYHNVLPDGEPRSGNSNLHLPQQEFARQLDILAETHEVVPIEAILGESSPSGRPRVVITFDDAYQGALTAGVDELVRRGMPATVFVAPGLVASVPWWDMLADRTDGVVPDETQRTALEELGGNTEAVLRWDKMNSGGSRPMERLPRIGTETELANAASSNGITLGSHSWSHPNLCTLTGTGLDTELIRPLQWLRSRFASVVPWLSFPYGLYSDPVQKAAAKAGYRGALRIDGGWVPRSSRSAYAFPRVNIPFGLSIDGFRLRLAGL